MQFFELIEHLRRQLSLPSLTPDSSGVCAIRFDDIVVTFTHVPSSGAFDLSTRIGRVNLKQGDVLRALEATRQGESSYAMSWDGGGEVSMRQRFFLQVLSFQHFFRALERFVNQVDHWRARLQIRG